MSFDENTALPERDGDETSMFRRIQRGRYRVIAFMRENDFVVHQLSLFCYHQLNCFSNMLHKRESERCSIKLRTELA
jgi:hypothetical protein